MHSVGSERQLGEEVKPRGCFTGVLLTPGRSLAAAADLGRVALQ